MKINSIENHNGRMKKKNGCPVSMQRKTQKPNFNMFLAWNINVSEVKKIIHSPNFYEQLTE